jgi:DNA-binding winged helix-turn-helix (wHTH) protein
VRLQFGDFTIDDDTRQLLREDRAVHLSPKAFDLLTILLSARPRALTKTELHARLWPDTFVSDANLAMLVAEIRSALGDNARAPRFVRTVQRHGYAFHGSATDAAHSATPQRGAGLKYWLLAPLRQIGLTHGENVVGRDPNVQVWLDSASVSRRHARIMVEGDRVTLEDLKSKNGTRVRGSQISAPLPLADGDEIRFGTIGLTFRIWAGGEATKTESDH